MSGSNRQRAKFKRIVRTYTCTADGCHATFQSDGNRVLYCQDHRAEAKRRNHEKSRAKTRGKPLPVSNPAQEFNREFAPVMRGAVCPVCERRMMECEC